MTRAHDQQNTPLKQNIKDLWNAIRGKSREDERNWIRAVLHEFKNIFIELRRSFS